MVGWKTSSRKCDRRSYAIQIKSSARPDAPIRCDVACNCRHAHPSSVLIVYLRRNKRRCMLWSDRGQRLVASCACRLAPDAPRRHGQTCTGRVLQTVRHRPKHGLIPITVSLDETTSSNRDVTLIKTLRFLGNKVATAARLATMEVRPEALVVGSRPDLAVPGNAGPMLPVPAAPLKQLSCPCTGCVLGDPLDRLLAGAGVS